MDRQKEIDLVRKRNADLNKQLDDLKARVEYEKMFEGNGYQSAKELIVDLEKLKQAWNLALEDLKEKQDECDALLSSLKSVQKDFNDVMDVCGQLASTPERAKLPKRTKKRIHKEIKEASEQEEPESE